MALLRQLFRSKAAAPDRNDGGRRPNAALAARVDSDVGTVVRAARKLSMGQRHGEALALIDQALRRAPQDGELVLARGQVLFDSSRYAHANEWLRKAAVLGVDNSSLFLQLGWTCLWTSDAQSAEPWMRKAVDAEPDAWLMHFGLASALRAQNRIDDAIASFERVIELAPDNVQALLQLADCALAQGRYARAAEIARRIIGLDGRATKAFTMLGIASIMQDRFDEAIEAFERAYELEAHVDAEIDPHLNLGICLRESGRLEEALSLYQQRLPSLPSIGANGHYAHALLLAGRIREGFVQYEFRWLEQPLLGRRPPYRKPVWDGQDLGGRTILLRTEQGIGDVFQFIRYAPYVKALGARVLLEVRRGVGELAHSFPGIDHVLGPDEAYPPFDYYIHLMSLPRVFGTELASIPATVPYIRADAARRLSWAGRLGEAAAYRVGLVWAGDPAHLRDRYRSIALALFAPLADIEGVQFYSLQKGNAARQLESPPVGMSIVDLAPDIRDFSDTAAVLDLLDLTISVDTSVVHLAGAMARPVWTLVANPPEWRWMTGRSDSPWYPTMRLFRQARQRDWASVIDDVADALRDELGHGRRALPNIEATFAALSPLPDPQHALPALTGVAETVAGIVQYDPSQPFEGKSIEYYGEYLKAQVDLLARVMTTDAVVIEISPGVGMHVLSLAPAIAARGHIFLYESRPLLAQILKQNLAANRISNITVMQRTLIGAAPGTFTGLGQRQASDVRPSTAYSETIDDLRMEVLNWIKIGPEDDAKSILEGAAETIWRLRPKLFVAVPDEQSALLVCSFARDFGYDCWRFETPLFNRANFNLRDADIFEGRTVVAILAIPEEVELGVPLEGCTRMTS